MGNAHLFQPNDIIALDPIWTWQDFCYRVSQISQQLKQDKINSLGLILDDAALQACVMLACFQTGTRVLLPPNLLADNKEWLEENTQLLLDNQSVIDYGKSQIPRSISPEFDMNNQTEIWLKTSGSSGEPKILVKTAKKMWQEAEAIASSLAFDKSQHFYVISSVSSQHHYGLSYRVMLPLYLGWRIGRYQHHYPELLISESERVDKSLWITSPALLNHLNLENQKLLNCGVSVIISAGGHLSPAVSNPIRHLLKCQVIECYGSTETGAIAFRHDDGLWQPTSYTQVGECNDGTLWVKSAWLDQVEYMADAVEFYQGQFKLLGRVDRIVKFADKRISLVQIEQQLLKHQWVTDCFIAKHPTHYRPAAWVALTTQGQVFLKQLGRSLFIKALTQYLAKTEELIAIPRYWRFASQLPRNSQAKISQHEFNHVFSAPQKELNNE